MTYYCRCETRSSGLVPLGQIYSISLLQSFGFFPDLSVLYCLEKSNYGKNPALNKEEWAMFLLNNYIIHLDFSCIRNLSVLPYSFIYSIIHLGQYGL